MATITVRGPDSLREYIRPVPDSYHDVQRLSYLGSGEYLVAYGQPVHIDPREAARVLREMQTVVPLGICGDMEILCLDMQLLYGPDPVMSADGVQRPLYIALAGRISIDLRDLLAHEVTHRLAAVLITQAEEQTLFAMLGQEYGSNSDPVWSRRPQERLAEWLSLALWDCPIRDPGIPQLTPDQVARVRGWALEQLGAGPTADIVAEGECITLQVGNPVMDRYGVPVTLDVAPFITNSRTMVPLRAIAEGLGRRVEWDPETWTVRIY